MRQNKLKKHFQSKTIISLFLLCLLISSLTVHADPTIEISPSEPKPKSTVEVTVDTNDDTVDEVYVLYQECESDSLCKLPENVTLTKSSGNMYTASITLEWDSATYLQINKIIMHNQSGYAEYEQLTKHYLDTSEPSNGGTSNGGGDNDTPGFEFAVIALSIMFISFIVYRRKR